MRAKKGAQTTKTSHKVETVSVRELVHVVNACLLGRNVADDRGRTFVVIGVGRCDGRLLVHVRPSPAESAPPPDGGRFLGFDAENCVR
jgi:hypothetical protein